MPDFLLVLEPFARPPHGVVPPKPLSLGPFQHAASHSASANQKISSPTMMIRIRVDQPTIMDLGHKFPAQKITFSTGIDSVYVTCFAVTWIHEISSVMSG